MAEIIAVANQKGGVGKTTTTVNLAWAFKQAGNKVLVIDCDPQGNLTSYFGHADPDIFDEEKKSISQCLLHDLPMSEVIIKGDIDLVPTGIELADTAVLLTTNVLLDGASSLKYSIEEIKDSYDYILIDCAPALGVLLINALTVANLVLIPVKTDSLSLKGLLGLTKSIKKIKVRINPALKICGILPTIYHANNNHDKKSLSLLQEEAQGSNIKVFEPIPSSTNFDKSVDLAKPTLEAFPQTKGIDGYTNVADYIIKRLRN
jgi:chromosome partitioning protein